MPRVRVAVEIPADHFRSYEDEASRRGVPVDRLVEQMVQGLIEELYRQEREGTDHPIIPA